MKYNKNNFEHQLKRLHHRNVLTKNGLKKDSLNPLFNSNL